MQNTYAALALIVLFVSVTYVIWGQELLWLRDFAPGLATEVLGIIFTLMFVQRILDRRQATGRARASKGGIRRAAAPLRDLSDMCSSIIKASIPQKPARPPKTYHDLFNSEWAGAVDRSDLTQARYSWSEETWLESASRSIRLSQHLITEILNVYSVHLDVDLIETLDELRDDPFLAQVEDFGEEIRALRGAGLDELDPREFSLGRSGPARARLMRTLLRAQKLYNKSGLGEERFGPLPEGFWSTEHPTQIGALYMDAAQTPGVQKLEEPD